MRARIAYIIDVNSLIIDDKKTDVQLLEKIWGDNIFLRYLRLVREGDNGQN